LTTVILGIVVLVAGGSAAWVLDPGPGVELVAHSQAPEDGLKVLAPNSRRMYPREEFRALIVGKTRAEVAAVLEGRKFGVQDGPPEVWHCATVTVDIETGRPDHDTAVVFGGDTVTDDRFQATPPGVKPGP
jgi:hypothetical protein